MFNSVEFLTKAYDSFEERDDCLRLLSVIGMSGKGFWLLFDHVVWLGKIKMFKVCGNSKLRMCITMSGEYKYEYRINSIMYKFIN